MQGTWAGRLLGAESGPLSPAPVPSACFLTAHACGTGVATCPRRRLVLSKRCASDTTQGMKNILPWGVGGGTVSRPRHGRPAGRAHYGRGEGLPCCPPTAANHTRAPLWESALCFGFQRLGCSEGPSTFPGPGNGAGITPVISEARSRS